MKNSKIEWTDHTFNSWVGCTKVSPGCANCYAETLDRNRFSKTMDGGSVSKPVTHWGSGAPRHRTREAEWRKPLAWNAEAEAAMDAALHDFGTDRYEAPPRPRVFCASLADWLDEEVPIAWLADLLTLIRETPCLDWLLLTKRPQNFENRVGQVIDAFLSLGAVGDFTKGGAVLADWFAEWRRGRAPHNVWMGTTAEDQARADERIPHLLRIPARVRFLSCEPLVGPVVLRDPGAEYGDGSMADLSDAPPGWDFPGVNWVICGGESGESDAPIRPMRAEWARALRDQCADAGVPYFFKQWGDWLPFNQRQPGQLTGSTAFVHNDFAWRVGKRKAGRLLDGRVHSEWPAVQFPAA